MSDILPRYHSEPVDLTTFTVTIDPWALVQAPGDAEPHWLTGPYEGVKRWIEENDATILEVRHSKPVLDNVFGRWGGLRRPSKGGVVEKEMDGAGNETTWRAPA